MKCPNCGNKKFKNEKCNLCGYEKKHIQIEIVKEIDSKNDMQEVKLENKDPFWLKENLDVAKIDDKKADKGLKYLCYIGFLWIIALFIPLKNKNKNIRFHIGQGIILSIVGFCVWIVSLIFNGIILSMFTEKIYVQGFDTGVYEVTALGTILSTLITVVPYVLILLLTVFGLLSVKNNVNRQLPIIGKYAFFKIK